MKKKNGFFTASGFLAAFAMWTAAVRLIDVQTIGPQGTSVGFAAMNRFVHEATGVHFSLYEITDWLGLVPVAVAMGFALLGFFQWFRRKRLHRVDYSLLVLGGFYLVVMAVYLLFEAVIINYRPVLINGVPEASYPSSTTMLVLCVMPTAVMQVRSRIRNAAWRRWVSVAAVGFTGFMVVGRLLSGVHWMSDIVGGVLLSTGLVLLYYMVIGLKKETSPPKQ